MDRLWWVVIVAVLVVAAVVVFLRFRQTQADQAQDRRITVQREGGAHSAGEEISQREDRRLGGMSAEDRAWETASLERQRDREARAPRETTNDSWSGGIAACRGAGGGEWSDFGDRRGHPHVRSEPFILTRCVVRSSAWHALCAMIALAGRFATRDRERMVPMLNYTPRRWGVALIAGLVACATFGVAPVQAQSVPIIVPPLSPVVIGITPGIPSVVVGVPGNSGVNSRAGLTWSTSGRADVDVDVDRHHGQAATR